MELKTPLYDTHVAAKGKIVPFGGYLLPVQYESGIIAEHMAVREKAGLFDVSHMGEVVLKGPDALANLNYMMTNDFSSMTDGRCRYSPMCNDEGGVVDDLLVYRLSADCYLIIVNASNRQKDVAWMQGKLFGEATLTDISDGVAQLALQGPKAVEILGKLTKAEDIPLKYYSFVRRGLVGDIPCLISRTGYTGEDGVELYCAPEQAATLWQLLLDSGRTEGLIPCGLGARDTLRMEAAMPLYGHEMNDSVSPLESGLGVFVKMGKADFVGKEALLAQGEPVSTRVGLTITGRGIAREQCPVYQGDRQVGITTSGTHCPYLGAAIAMALIETSASALGTPLEVAVRGRRIAAEVTPLPFYKRQK